MTRRPEMAPGQISLDISNPGDLRWVIPDMPEVRPISDVIKTTKLVESRSLAVLEKKEIKKPDIAYINDENLAIVREITHSKDSDEDLISKLVVFKGWTPISLEPAEERKRNYSVKLNIGVIAWKSLVTDNYCIPEGYDSYQVLGVYSPFKGTGKVSSDKCMRKYATVQKTGCSHPENIRVGSYFFARPDDEIRVEKSRIGRTSYWTKKK